MGLTTLTMTWLLLAAGPAQAGDPVPINKRSFKIPILIDPARRAQIKELKLFVSNNQGQTWGQEATRTPDQDSFTFSAPGDGVYWFTVAVVDQQNNQQPPDVYRVVPNQRILVDTLAPDVKFKSVERVADEAEVAWEIQEDHPNLTALRLEYRPTDAPAWAPWNTVAVNSELNGRAHFRPPSAAAFMLRMEIRDLAGNVGSAQREVPAGTGADRLTGSPALGNGAPNVHPPVEANPPPGAQSGPGLNPPPSTTNQNLPLPGNSPIVGQGGPALLAADASSPAAGMPLRVSSAQPTPLPTTHAAPTLPATSMPGNLNEPAAGSQRIIVASSASERPLPGMLTPPPLPQPRGAAVQAMVINYSQIGLEYEVMKTGPSGLGKVELWLTYDDGRTWKYYADDPDLKSPLTVNLPGEGSYGLRLVTTSGAGLTEGPPSPGDVPEIRVEVDTTLPVVQLYEPKPDAQHRQALVLSWSASDRNLTSKPVTLEYAERHEGPWLPIAMDLPAVGSYSWPVPTKISYRVYLRAVAQDTAGNRGVAETLEPLLVDLNKTKARLIGLSTTMRRP